MLKEVTGNLLESGAEALVNTVNTVGVMGKGVALQFKQAFPDNFRAYEAACRRHEVRLGHMLVFRRDSLRALSNPRYIINFPTKAHWRGKSRIKDIEAGLGDLVRVVKEENCFDRCPSPRMRKRRSRLEPGSTENPKCVQRYARSHGPPISSIRLARGRKDANRN